MLKHVIFAGILAAAVFTAARAHAAGDELATARDLYASASYEDALKLLNGLPDQPRSRDDKHVIGLYRALCLVALGRANEADQAMQALVTDDPFYRPAADDLPPRVQEILTATRKRLLPSIIQDRYQTAKAAFDQKNYKVAADGFQQVLDGLKDPDVGPLADQAPLSDVRTLAMGFHDLAAQAAAPPPAPAPKPVVDPDAPVPGRIYSLGEARVVPPVPVMQMMPPFPGRITYQRSGVVEVVINESGSVESVSMPTPIDPQFDSHVMTEARKWQYRPATIGGTAVKFRKRIQISLTPTN